MTPGANVVTDALPELRGRELTRGTAGLLLATYVAEHATHLRALDAGVRAGEEEAVHELRIAARRLRSALTTFRPLLSAEVTDPVREDLRWLGQSLGEARDAQVLRGHLMAMIAEQPSELVIGRVAARIDDQLRTAHQTGREQALVALDSARYLRLLEALEEVITSIPLHPGAGVAATKAMPRLLARDTRRLRRAVGAIEAARGPEGRDIAFHEARKKAKRLRYGAEIASPALGRRAAALAASAKKLQESLGVHQDTVVARRRLRELAEQAHLEGDNAFTFGLLHALEQARAERAEADFAKAWHKFAHRELPRWLE